MDFYSTDRYICCTTTYSYLGCSVCFQMYMVDAMPTIQAIFMVNQEVNHE